MKVLKGILIGLVVLLVVILGVGGALIGFNHEGHNPTDVATEGTLPQNGTQKDISAGKQNVHGTTGTDDNLENKGAAAQEQPRIVVVKEQIPPREYIKKVQQAQGLIKEATALMASDPNMVGHSLPGDLNQQNTNPNQTPQGQNHTASGMEQIHRGIYKMAQGITLMDQAIEGMNKEIENAEVPQYYGNYPYGYWVYPNQSPNQQAPYLQQPQHQPQQNPQDHGSTHSPSLGGLFSLTNMIYIIYGFLFLSIIGAFVAVIGFINSLFKPASAQE